MKFVALGVIALGLTGAATGYLQHDRYGRYQQETNDAVIEADQVAISSKIAGYVKSVAAADNQAVTRRSLLIEIDPVDYTAKLNVAEADTEAAVAAARATAASKAEAEGEVDKAIAELRAAQSALDFANREVGRYDSLVASGAEPASILSQLKANRDRAAAGLAAQQSALTIARRKVDAIIAASERDAAQAGVVRARVQTARNDLDATRLVAPVDGRLANRSVRVGQFVQPGMRLMTIVPVNDIYVIANFKETQVGLMRSGQPATISVDALPGIEFKGKVVSVAPGTGANFSLIKPENATGNFTKIVQRIPVRIRIDVGPAARKVLVPGLSLAVSVDTRANREELDAIRAEQSRRVGA